MRKPIDWKLVYNLQYQTSMPLALELMYRPCYAVRAKAGASQILLLNWIFFLFVRNNSLSLY